MIVIVTFTIGATLGAYRARANKGNRLDMVQYAAIYGLIFAIIGVFITIVLGKML